MAKYKLIKLYPGSSQLGYITPDKIGNNSEYYKRYSEFWQEIVEIPEYVECISINLGNTINTGDFKIGSIYKVDTKRSCEVEILLTGETGERIISMWQEKYSKTLTTFKPSTKEVYDLQELNKKFIVGKWYKYNGSYTKFSDIINNLFYGSEHIFNGDYKDRSGTNKTWIFIVDDSIQEATLEEIQQYLPESHSDKIKEDWIPKVGDWVVITDSEKLTDFRYATTQDFLGKISYFKSVGSLWIENIPNINKRWENTKSFCCTGFKYRRALPNEIPINLPGIDGTRYDVKYTLTLQDVENTLKNKDDYDEIISHLKEIIKRRDRYKK